MRVQTDVIVLLLPNINLLNGQLFQKRERRNFQRFLDIKQLRSDLSSNIAGLRLIKGMRLLKNVNIFKRDFR